MAEQIDLDDWATVVEATVQSYKNRHPAAAVTLQHWVSDLHAAAQAGNAGGSPVSPT
jgi:hypothetical protein